MLIAKIGEAAMLEQTAEEATELAQACLKYARFLRHQNPTPKTKTECLDNLEEEIADVTICLQELRHGRVVQDGLILDWIKKKRNRMRQRLTNAENQ